MPRTIAIGDIHGCSLALRGLLERIRPRPEDLIVTLGDYIDRGPDSKGVIDTLIDLSRTCRLVPILGNHEEMLLNVIAGTPPLHWLLAIGGGPTLDSYGPGRDLGRIPAEHIAFLRDCREWYQTERHIFLHANYDEDTPVEELTPEDLRWESLRDHRPGPHMSGKQVIVGHTSQKNAEILDLGHLICIDTFCHGGGWLTGLDVDTGEVWQVDRTGYARAV